MAPACSGARSGSTTEQFRVGIDVELRRRVTEVGPKLGPDDVTYAWKVALERLTATPGHYDKHQAGDVTVISPDDSTRNR